MAVTVHRPFILPLEPILTGMVAMIANRHPRPRRVDSLLFLTQTSMHLVAWVDSEVVESLRSRGGIRREEMDNDYITKALVNSDHLIRHHRSTSQSIPTKPNQLRD